MKTTKNTAANVLPKLTANILGVELLQLADALKLTVTEGARSMILKNNRMVMSPLMKRVAVAQAAVTDSAAIAGTPASKSTRKIARPAPAAEVEAPAPVGFQPMKFSKIEAKALLAKAVKADEDDDSAAQKEINQMGESVGLDPDDYWTWDELANALIAGEVGKPKPSKKAGKAAKGESKSTFEELGQLGSIVVNDKVTIKIRKVKSNGVVSLDIRKFLTTDRYTGHTREGVTLDAKGVATLAKALAAFAK